MGAVCYLASIAEVFATLLDEGRYLCSERTMYRILEDNNEVRERRDVLRHLHAPKPELLATRPYVSNDNPYSESAFKTLKYRPGFPDRFGCMQDARMHCARFFDWCNCEHHHASIGLCTPHEVHRATANATRLRRASVLDAAFVAHPERFVRGRPTPPSLPTEVWINKPKPPVSSTPSTDHSAQ